MVRPHDPKMICQDFGIALSQFFSEGRNMAELTDEQLAMFRRWAALMKEQKMQ